MWKDVPEFPGYQANSLGDVRSFRKSITNPKTLKQTPVGEEGHLRVFLYRDKVRYPLLVHRVIAKTFIPNPNEYPVVRHKDDDPTNNRVDNLMWGTQRDNIEDCMNNHGMNYDGMKDYNERRKTPVQACDITTGETQVFDSQSSAARSLGISQGNIWTSLKTHKPTKGFVFEYLDEEECLDDY